MLERLPKVGERVFDGCPVQSDLQQGSLDQGLGVQSIKVIVGTKVCPAGGLLLHGKPLQPGVYYCGCVCGAHRLPSLLAGTGPLAHMGDFLRCADVRLELGRCGVS
jgi:hypothetical protein